MAEHKCLSAALAAAQAEYPAIRKTSVNPHFKSSYADLADGMGPIRPVLARHGLAYVQTFCVVDGVLMLRTKLLFGDEQEVSELPITQPAKPQDFISLTTYYRRVALFSLCGITPADEDDDGNVANATATTQPPPRRGTPFLPPDRVPRSPTEETDRALAKMDAARNGIDDKMLDLVTICDPDGTVRCTTSVLREALEAYAAAKQIDARAAAVVNVGSLRALTKYAKGKTLEKLQNEIAAVEAVGEAA